MTETSMQVFAVDDNRQVLLDIKRAAKSFRLPEVRDASSEQEGLKLVRNFRGSKFSPLFIVDLKLRDSDSGFRIIEAIRKKQSLRFAPIVILTSSDEQAYVNRGYELGANSYIVKDDDPKELNKILEKILKFWKSVSLHDLPAPKKFAKRANPRRAPRR